jgi:hypothetical protein
MRSRSTAALEETNLLLKTLAISALNSVLFGDRMPCCAMPSPSLAVRQEFAVECGSYGAPHDSVSTALKFPATTIALY